MRKQKYGAKSDRSSEATEARGGRAARREPKPRPKQTRRSAEISPLRGDKELNYSHTRSLRALSASQAKKNHKKIKNLSPS